VVEGGSELHNVTNNVRVLFRKMFMLLNFFLFLVRTLAGKQWLACQLRYTYHNLRNHTLQFSWRNRRDYESVTIDRHQMRGSN
jgi:hypothetical protein